MKKISRFILGLCLFLLLNPLLVKAEEKLPESREEALESELEELSGQGVRPGTYTIELRYKVDGEIIEQTIQLYLTETPIEERFMRNKEALGTVADYTYEDDYFCFSKYKSVGIFTFAISFAIVVIAGLLFVQYVISGKLMKEVFTLFEEYLK